MTVDDYGALSTERLLGLFFEAAKQIGVGRAHADGWSDASSRRRLAGRVGSAN
jgi:hypothetical protein